MTPDSNLFTLDQFDFNLPSDLIAQFPCPERSQSRLFVVGETPAQHRHWRFNQLLDLLQPNDILVFNDTKVIPMRLYGQKSSGGKIEVLIERILQEQRALAHIRATHAPKVGAELWLPGAATVRVVGRQDALFELEFLPPALDLLKYLQEYGEIPLPHYMQRAPQNLDQERYQTVYARMPGAAAAPTAGLHFDTSMLAQLAARQIATAFVTLHVGAGTFQPIRVADIRTHVMHAEFVTVSDDTVEAIHKAKKAGGRVIAIGTTAVRSLETAAQLGRLMPFCGDTRLFIYPGFQFHCVDAMITNFHLPKSSLLLLVSAFAGTERILKAYQTAIAEKYRFFSYGDAMFLTPAIQEI